MEMWKDAGERIEGQRVQNRRHTSIDKLIRLHKTKTKRDQHFVRVAILVYLVGRSHFDKYFDSTYVACLRTSRHSYTVARQPVTSPKHFT